MVSCWREFYDVSGLCQCQQDQRALFKHTRSLPHCTPASCQVRYSLWPTRSGSLLYTSVLESSLFHLYYLKIACFILTGHYQHGHEYPTYPASCSSKLQYPKLISKCLARRRLDRSMVLYVYRAKKVSLWLCPPVHKRQNVSLII